MRTRASGGGTWLERAVSPPLLFVSGMATVPAFLLQGRIDVRAGQVAVLFVLVVLTGTQGGLRLLRTVLVLLLSTVLFNLVTPFGRVLIEWGPLVITQGALANGLLKGLSLVGLMLLSRLSVRRSVVLPGVLGLYASATLAYLNRMLEEPLRMPGRGLLPRLDKLFESVLLRESLQRPQGTARPQSIGIVAAAAFVAANWSLVFFLD